MFNGNGEFIGVDDPPPRAISIVNLLPKYLPIKWMDIFCSPLSSHSSLHVSNFRTESIIYHVSLKKDFGFQQRKKWGSFKISKSSINDSYQDVISFSLAASSEPVWRNILNQAKLRIHTIHFFGKHKSKLGTDVQHAKHSRILCMSWKSQHHGLSKLVKQTWRRSFINYWARSLYLAFLGQSKLLPTWM